MRKQVLSEILCFLSSFYMNQSGVTFRELKIVQLCQKRSFINFLMNKLPQDPYEQDMYLQHNRISYKYFSRTSFFKVASIINGNIRYSRFPLYTRELKKSSSVQLVFTFILRIQTRAVRLYILEFGSRESEQGSLRRL